MKVITKSIENGAGFPVSCWVATSGSYDLSSGSGTVTLEGYKDVTAFQEHKQSCDGRTIRFSLSDLSSFEAVWTEIATKLVTSGELAGGSIVDA